MRTHGLPGTYNSGCRCDPCLLAGRAYQREYKRRMRGTAPDSERKRFLKEIIAALKENPCTDCGGYFNDECMDFDHVSGAKKFDVSHFQQGHISVEDVLDEIAKCELVCANCHRTRTKVRFAEKRRELMEGIIVNEEGVV